MLRKATFAALSFLFIFSIPLVQPNSVRAVECSPEDTVCKQIEEFKLRRSGDQMNLETWYSGKYTTDRSDPASIGFSSIVLLDLYERISGGQDVNNFEETLKELISQRPDGTFVATIPITPIASPGITGQMASIMGQIFKSPPVSFSNYVASVQKNIAKHGIVQPAYAQGSGFGFSNLLPVIEIWKAFRNVAYFVFVLVFVLYGFMIMFRMKIDPQNVATFQTAIPKVVVTLLLITFAYAIAGFMIDLMFVVFNLILSIFQASGLIGGVDNHLVKVGSGQYGLIPAGVMSIILSAFFVPNAILNVLVSLPEAVNNVLGLILIGPGLILRIILILAVIYSYAKLIFKLFEAYITIIVQVIFSPIILLQDVLPGSDAFGSWLRNIIAHLSVFPVTMVMLLLSYIFMIQPVINTMANLPIIGGLAGSGTEYFTGVQNLNNPNAGFSMPLINNGTNPLVNWIPYFGGAQVSSNGILVLIGFFIILMSSKYVDMVRDALKVPPFKYGSAISEALNFGFKPIGFARKQAGDAWQLGNMRDTRSNAGIAGLTAQQIQQEKEAGYWSGQVISGLTGASNKVDPTR